MDKFDQFIVEVLALQEKHGIKIVADVCGNLFLEDEEGKQSPPFVKQESSNA